MAYMYIDRTPYQRSMIKNMLLSKRYKYIIGLDFGGGDSVMYLYGLNAVGNAELQPLKIYENSALKIPTYIRYGDNDAAPSIGAAAIAANGFCSDIKTNPYNWDYKGPSGRTYGEIIRDYIKVLWGNAVEYNNVLSELEGDYSNILLSVGCPSSPDWTSNECVQKYRDLITEATGCPNVTVMPESTAAVMDAVRRLGSGISADSGIAVFDLGSTTFDFTYVKAGAVMIVKSCPIGGSDIDYTILLVLLKRAGKTERDLDITRVRVILCEIRGYKEAYYEKVYNALKANIPLDQVIISSHCILPFSTDDTITFRMDGELMKEVLDYDPGDGKKPLRKAMTDFFNSCCSSIPMEYAETPTYVVVTGGTSYIGDCVDMIEKAFGTGAVTDSTPDTAVAYGLCLSKEAEMKNRSNIQEAYEQTERTVNSFYNDTLCPELAKYIHSLILPVIADVLRAAEADGKTHKVNDIVQVVSDRVNATDSCSNQTRARYSELIGKFRQDSYDSYVTETANRLSEAIYKGVLSKAPDVDMSGFDAELLSIGNTIDISRFVKKTIYSLTGSLAKRLLNTILKPKTLKHEKLTTICNLLPELPEDFSYRMTLKILLANKELRVETVALLGQIFDVALGKILYLIFDRISLLG